MSRRLGPDLGLLGSGEAGAAAVERARGGGDGGGEAAEEEKREEAVEEGHGVEGKALKLDSRFIGGHGGGG